MKLRPTEIVIHHRMRDEAQIKKHAAGIEMVHAWGCEILDMTTGHEGDLTLRLKWPGPYTPTKLVKLGDWPDFEVLRWEMYL